MQSMKSHEAVEQYQKLSTLSVWALVFGLLCATTLLHPGAWLLPLIAVLFAIFALRAIARQPDILFGRKAAIAGMALGLFFGACAPTHYIMHRRALYAQAREFCTEWLQLIRDGNIGAAHQATLQMYRRQPAESDFAAYYGGNADAANDLEKFFGDPIAHQLRELGENARIEFRENVDLIHEFGTDLMILRFDVYPIEDSEHVHADGTKHVHEHGKSIPVQLVVRRRPPAEAYAGDIVQTKSYWSIVVIENANQFRSRKIR